MSKYLHIYGGLCLQCRDYVEIEGLWEAPVLLKVGSWESWFDQTCPERYGLILIPALKGKVMGPGTDNIL